MVDENKKEEYLKNVPIPEKKISASEQAVRFDWNKERKTEGRAEKKEISADEKMNCRGKL